MQETLRIICEALGVDPELAKAKQRSNKAATDAKKLFCYLQRAIYGTRNNEIAEFIGIGHDVSSYHYQSMKTWVKIYPWWFSICDDLEYKIIKTW